MGLVGGWLIRRLLELKALQLLWDEYGGVGSASELYELFRHQTELAQFGTVTAVVLTLAIIGGTVQLGLTRVVPELLRISRRIRLLRSILLNRTGRVALGSRADRKAQPRNKPAR